MGLGIVTYFSILRSPQYFQNGESYKLKIDNGDYGNLRAEPPSWSRAEAIVGEGGDGGKGA